MSAWENRERRKQKDYDKELAGEESRRVDMVGSHNYCSLKCVYFVQYVVAHYKYLVYVSIFYGFAFQNDFNVHV